MNTAISTTSGSNTGIGFTVPVDWFKPGVEDIVLTDRLLRRGKGTDVGDGNGGRPLPVWMGVEIVYKRSGIWKYYRDPSEV